MSNNCRTNNLMGFFAVVARMVTPALGVATACFTVKAASVASMYAYTEDETAEFPSQSAYFADDHVQWDIVSSSVTAAAILAVLTVAGMVLCAALAVRSKLTPEGLPVLNRFDRLWAEVHIVLALAAAGGTVAVFYPLYIMLPAMSGQGYKPVFPDDYFFDLSNKSVIWLITIGAYILILIFVSAVVSLTKKSKAHRLASGSLAGILIGGLIRGIRNPFRVLFRSDKYTRKYILIGIGMIILAMTWVGAIIDLIIIFVKVPKLANKFRVLGEGVAEIKSGNLQFEIPYDSDPDGPIDGFDRLAADINEISQATNLAVKNELKTQRLKTELISNVSHDLKTPLTSMITYVDLLKTEGPDSENAPEYIRIIDEKTKRLKLLTENLFEAAKASSGSTPCEIADIDISAIVDQALAEMEGRLNEKSLKVITSNRPENPLVRADGQLLWRVMENLLSNVSKYALEGSRVYINLSTIASSAGKNHTLLEIKNISADALNIPADELMERFKRGDESRNTEGSGLGLAIAKDLTALMGGVFEITIDGDLFKASVMLEQAEAGAEAGAKTEAKAGAEAGAGTEAKAGAGAGAGTDIPQ